MSTVSRKRGPKPVVRNLVDEVAGLMTLSFDELRARFRRLYRRAAPACLSRDLIGRLVAHRLQEQQFGKLDDELARHLARLARGHVTRRRIKTGSVLVREHDGVSHEVVIVPGGFLRMTGRPTASSCTDSQSQHPISPPLAGGLFLSPATKSNRSGG
ncbi:DUF2924 domain-containing protein [Bosea sp. PAMC 26642]|uniref:DUF2924 domain-containing protein n=1 Tax=Bosea sp. (strain PAMC 26642) TaxID=1792307 RepID=UPI00143A60A5|nr:DUF2924 domain-containing protein [Bosea sp. PAMC 26642]